MTKTQDKALNDYVKAACQEAISNHNGWTRDYRHANRTAEMKQAFLDTLTTTTK